LDADAFLAKTGRSDRRSETMSVIWMAVGADWLTVVMFVMALCRAAARGEVVLSRS
jgi:hypothetical protein